MEYLLYSHSSFLQFTKRITPRAINIVVIIFPVIILLLACKLLFINVFTIALRDLKHIAGTAGALYSMLQILGPIIGTALASLIHIKTQLPIAIIFLSAFLLMLIIFTLEKMMRKQTKA